MWAKVAYLRSRSFQMNRNAHFTRQYIRRAAGENGERNARVQHAVRHFIDCSVAACRNN